MESLELEKDLLKIDSAIITYCPRGFDHFYLLKELRGKHRSCVGYYVTTTQPFDYNNFSASTFDSDIDLINRHFFKSVLIPVFLNGVLINSYFVKFDFSNKSFILVNNKPIYKTAFNNFLEEIFTNYCEDIRTVVGVYEFILKNLSKTI